MDTYEKEVEELMEIFLDNRKSILNKYDNYKMIGLDGSPYEEELKKENKRFWKEIDKLKLKYNISQ